MILEILGTTSAAVTSISILSTTFVSTSYFCYKLYKKIKIIYNQLTPNGGGSLADTIHQIRQHQHIGEMRLQVVWENMQQGYYECDPHGEMTYANRKLCDKFGMSSNDMLGRGWMRALTTQAERDRVQAEWINSINHDLPYDTTYKIKNQRTGIVSTLRTQAWACRDKSGKVLWMFGTSEEVVEN